MSNYERLQGLYMDLAIKQAECEKAELADAEAKGEEIYYDMSDPKTVNSGIDDLPMQIGQFKRRKKETR